MKIISVESHKRAEFINVTPLVLKYIQEKNVKTGVCIIFCPHTTAGLTINENADPDVKSDIINYLEKIIPSDYKGFSHAEGNSAAHIKSSLMGSTLNLMIDEGRLLLGTWQGIYFCEFDGPRQREFHVKVI